MTDKELILKLAGADARTFEMLYKQHFKMVEYFILKNSGNSADAQDVFQDSLVVLYEKSLDPTFELTCAIKTYIYSIARNLWLKKIRDHKLQLNVADFEKHVTILDEEIDLNNEKKLVSIEDALKQLGDKCREIIVQFYFYKKKMEEIAHNLDYTNAENAKNQKYKCMQQLKKLVNNE